MIRQQIFHSFIRDAKASVVYDGTVIGYLGEVHPTVAANYAIKERVYIAVVDMPEIVSRASFDYKYEGITNFPVSSRDLSMVVPKNILVGDIEKVFDEKGGAYLESYELFDVYEGEQIEKRIQVCCIFSEVPWKRQELRGK